MDFLRSVKMGALSIGLCGLLCAGPAHAATEQEKAGARAAATQGQAAFDQKRWADALDLFTRAESLVHSPVHLLYKARALVQLGRLVEARETYVEVTREPAPATPSPALTKSQDAAHDELAALQPRLANVLIKVVGPGAADAVVTIDGTKLPSALVGISSPVDPGTHKFQATGQGVQSDVAALILKEGGSETVSLELKPAPGVVAPGALVAPPVGALATPNGTTTAAPGPDLSPAPAHHGSGLRIGSYVAFGVGAAGLAVGTVFALTAKSKYDDANALCKSFPCDLTRAQNDQRTKFSKDGDSAKTLSLVGFIAGGVGIAAGATLFVLSNKKSEAAQAEVHPWIGLGSVGLGGKF
jgi:hypothetical protein